MNKFENLYQDAVLMRKFLQGEANEAERYELEKRLAECPDLQKVYEQLQDGRTLKEAFGEYRYYSSESAYQSFLQRIGRIKKPEHKSSFFRIGWSVAAAIVVLAVGFSFYLLSNYSVEEGKGRTLIQPGIQQAQLTLPDGSVIDVHKKDVDVVVDGVHVKYQKGILSYQPTVVVQEEEENTDESAVQSNVLVIPRGGENTVVLADGTLVHLNAGSKLTYPVRFAEKRRVVLLEGEGYFRVKEDKEHPFIVKTNFGEIMVHGTEFNVNAYNDAKACYATLVNGKVSCLTPSQKTVTLSPGEQAVFADGRLEKRFVDVEECIGWVKGEYVFHNKTLEEIMQAFERWYDVCVYYETPALRNLTYSGNLKRYSTINTFLDALEITGDIYYQINGRNILIYENE